MQMFFTGCMAGILLGVVIEKISENILSQKSGESKTRNWFKRGNSSGCLLRQLVLCGVTGAGLFLIVKEFGYTWQSAAMCFITVDLLIIAGVDQKTMIIPNRLLLILLFPAAVAIWAAPEPGLIGRIAGFFAVSIPMLLMTVAIPGCFGGGDIKLMAVCGLILGWKGIFLAMFLAVLSGGFYGIYLLLAKKIERGAHFAFGPFLVLGIWTAMVYQDSVIGWYLTFFSWG